MNMFFIFMFMFLKKMFMFFALRRSVFFAVAKKNVN